ncbi:cyclase-associated protein [Infundibulicybe gibba]|nr:cyclase-associated protein [Infundibulicybe gibba]
MSGGLYSLATIIKRLEAATLRIEDIAASQGLTVHAPQPPSLESPGNENLLAGAPTSPPPPPPPPPQQPTPVSSAPLEDPKSVVAFDELVIEGRVKPFLELTRSFAGASVIEIVALVEKQYKDLRAFLRLVGLCQQPDPKALEELLTPLQADIEAISRAKEANRKERDWFTHLTFIGEGAPSVGWVVSPKPGPYIDGIKESADYYGLKLTREFKEKDPKHVEWVKAFVAILQAMRNYVMEYHTTGLAWQSKGITVEEYQSASASAGAGAPPPPAAAGGGAAAVFAELNRGEDVTKGLRKVDRSQMTHKNPTLRAGSVVPGTASSATPPKRPIKPSKPSSLAGKKPPKFALDGNKWAIEYQENEAGLTVTDVELNQAVNIFGCKNTTVVIKGKVNAVTLVNCIKTAVLIESVVSAISVTNSPSFTLQITGSAPMIQLDSTDSGQIYLSRASLSAEITTAKCSSINVSLPVEGEEDGVFEEQPVPEMLKTVVQGGKLVTTIVEHTG